MSNKYWRTYKKNILGEEKKSLLALVLNNILKNKPKPRRQGLGFSNSSVKNQDFNTESRLYVSRLIAELTNENNIDLKKGKIMDDFKLIRDVEQVIIHLKEFTKDMEDYNQALKGQNLEKMTLIAQQEKELFNLGLVLLKSGEWGDYGVAEEFMKVGFPINFTHPASRKTLLHVAATYSAGTLVNKLIDSDKCDYLLRDSAGQLAYDISYKFARYSGIDERDYDTTAINEQLFGKTLDQAKDEGVEVDFIYGHDVIPK